MEMYPLNFDKSKAPSLQSRLFGHRMKQSQTKYEYLIEFLQVAIAPKLNLKTEKTYTCMFPIDPAGMEDGLSFFPETGMWLKRFVFLPKSKLEGKAEVDKTAYEHCVRELERHVEGGNEPTRRNSIAIIQNLLNGFSAVNQNRSWFDQNLLPICPEVILPEGMGVKSQRKSLSFEIGSADIDEKFDFHKYTYMCRGGEIYYLHLLNAVNQYPDYAPVIETRLNEMIHSFPQFSYLCHFVQNTWDNYMMVPPSEKAERKLKKDLVAIPLSFSKRNQFTLSELKNFLNSKMHPFEKMEILSYGIILQLMRMMYVAAATEKDSNCWVIDVNCKGHESAETKKAAITAFHHNEEVITHYLYRGLEEMRAELRGNDHDIIESAADDSYRLFRKLGKAIGIVIPVTGPGMRFSLSEEIIKFFVLSMIPPKSMITLNEFMELLYSHYQMVIGPEQYRMEMERGAVKQLGDLSFLEENKLAFSQKLKDCGFLRDLSDSTAIVENPYGSEDKV